jgi:two-component system, OmpR family, sensor kinase
MECPTSSILTSIRVLSRDPQGTLTVRQDGRPALACEVAPALAELMAAARAAGGPVPATLTVAGGEPQAVVLRALDADSEIALVLSRHAFDEQLDPVIEHLVNQIAHDVRNHVFSVGLQAELGARRAAPTPEVRAHFDAVLRQIDSLKAYIEKLLLFGRPVTPSLAATDLEGFLREQVQRYQFAWDQSGAPISVSIESSGEARSVALDRRLLAHGFREVLDNAVRSASPPPPIVVRLRFEADRVHIEVADQGPGIPAATLDQVFTPMRVRRAGGAGIGLPIARKMAEAHGGSLDLESAPGGTTVRISLPAEVQGG